VPGYQLNQSSDECKEPTAYAECINIHGIIYIYLEFHSKIVQHLTNTIIWSSYIQSIKYGSVYKVMARAS